MTMNLLPTRYVNHLSRLIYALSLIFIVLGLTLMHERVPERWIQAFSAILVKIRFCETDCSLGEHISPSLALGLLVTLTGFFSLLIVRFRKCLVSLINLRYLNLLRMIVFLFSGIFLPLIAFFKYFSHDSFEHVHCAWMIKNGLLPYVNFFQNHNPLFWMLLVPFLKAGPESSQILIWLRLGQVAGVMIVLWLTNRIAKQVSLSNEGRWLALVLLVTMACFLLSTVDIRPDLWQTILGMISIIFFLRYIDWHKRLDIAAAGFFAGSAFLFLQKAVFLFAAYVLILSLLVLRKRLLASSLLWFFISFLFPVMIFMGILWQMGMFTDYLIDAGLFNLYHFNITLHVTFEGPFHFTFEFKRLPFVPMSMTSPGVILPFGQDNLFWILAALSTAHIFLSKNTLLKLKTVAFFGLLLWLPIYLLRIPFAQYLLPAIPLLSIAIAYAIQQFFQKMNISRIWQLTLVVFLSLSAALVYVRYGFLYPSNENQRLQIDYVLANSVSQDRVYDGDIQFNLFRPDLHYFWHYFDQSMRWHRGLDIYNWITDDRFGDYDICGLVDQYHPKFISTFGLDPVVCGISADYCVTPFEGLLIRKQNGECPTSNI